MVVKCLTIAEVSTPQHGVVFQHEFVLEDKSKANSETLAVVLKIIRKNRMRDIDVDKDYKLELVPYLFVPKEKKEESNGKRSKDKSGKERDSGKTVDS